MTLTIDSEVTRTSPTYAKSLFHHHWPIQRFKLQRGPAPLATHLAIKNRPVKAGIGPFWPSSLGPHPFLRRSPRHILHVLHHYIKPVVLRMPSQHSPIILANLPTIHQCLLCYGKLTGVSPLLLQSIPQEPCYTIVGGQE
jgi:hypothetical protein